MKPACLFMGEPYFSGFEAMLKKVAESYTLVAIDFAGKIHWQYREFFEEVLELKEFTGEGLNAVLDAFAAKYTLGCCLCFSEYHVALRERALTKFGVNITGRDYSEIMRNKARMREALHGSGLRQPRSFMAKDLEDVIAVGKTIGYPLVVKPLLGYAGMGVIKAEGEGSLRQAYLECAKTIRIKQSQSYAFHGIPSGTVLVEEYVAGEEFAVDAIVHDSRVQSFYTAEKGMTENGRYFPENLLVTPAASSSRSPLGKAVRILVEALGIRCGVLHAEFRITQSGEVVFLEVGYRPGLRKAVLKAYGVDLAYEDFLVRTGREPSGKPNRVPTRHVCNVLLYPERFGKYRRINPDRLPAGAEFTELMPSGTAVAPLPYNDGFIGNVWMEAGTRKKLLEKMAEFDMTGLIEYT